MKKSELIQMIRTEVKRAVSGEVEKQIKEIFIKEGVKSLFNENASSSNLSELATKGKVEIPNAFKREETKPNKKRNYSADPMLNRILNETKGGIPQDDGGYPMLGGGVFTSDRINEVLGRNQLGLDAQTKREIAAAETIAATGVPLEAVPEEVTNALVRDYSGLMKKFAENDKRRGK